MLVGAMFLARWASCSSRPSAATPASRSDPGLRAARTPARPAPRRCEYPQEQADARGLSRRPGLRSACRKPARLRHRSPARDRPLSVLSRSVIRSAHAIRYPHVEDLQKVEQCSKGANSHSPRSPGKTPPLASWREKWLADARAIRHAEGKFLERYQDFLRPRRPSCSRPRSAGIGERMSPRSRQEAAKPPAPLAEPLPDSPVVNQPRGRAVTYRVPYEFQRVYEARRDWNYAEID